MATGGIPLAKLEPQSASSSRSVIPVPFSKLLAIEMKARETGVGKRAVNPNYTTTTSQLDGGESKKKYKNDSHSGESVECKKGSGCQPSVHKEAAAGVVWQKENHHPTRDDKLNLGDKGRGGYNSYKLSTCAIPLFVISSPAEGRRRNGRRWGWGMNVAFTIAKSYYYPPTNTCVMSWRSSVVSFCMSVCFWSCTK